MTGNVLCIDPPFGPDSDLVRLREKNLVSNPGLLIAVALASQVAVDRLPVPFEQ